MAALVGFIKYKSELLASMTEMERFVKGKIILDREDGGVVKLLSR